MTEPRFEPPTPNLPLLRKILDHIDSHPDEWNQRFWFSEPAVLREIGREVPACGTAFCIAGHAVAMSEGVSRGSGYVEPASGRGWDEAGADALGLVAHETLLFGPDNTRADVQRYAEMIAARAGERL